MLINKRIPSTVGYITAKRNVTVLLIRTREVPFSNLGPETGWPWDLSSFSLVPPGKYGDSTLNLLLDSSDQIYFRISIR
jgi:hypothetical protein